MLKLKSNKTMNPDGEVVNEILKLPCGSYTITDDCKSGGHIFCNDDVGIHCIEHDYPMVCKCSCHNPLV
jgi:hypothetical protein